MRNRSALYSLALIAVLGLSYFGWLRAQPAAAQQSPPIGGPEGQPPRGYPPFMGPMGRFGQAQITANNNYVFVLRGNIITVLRANDLSVVGSKTIPEPDAGGQQGR